PSRPIRPLAPAAERTDRRRRRLVLPAVPRRGPVGRTRSAGDLPPAAQRRGDRQLRPRVARPQGGSRSDRMLHTQRPTAGKLTRLLETPPWSVDLPIGWPPGME